MVLLPFIKNQPNQTKCSKQRPGAREASASLRAENKVVQHQKAANSEAVLEAKLKLENSNLKNAAPLPTLEFLDLP